MTKQEKDKLSAIAKSKTYAYTICPVCNSNTAEFLTYHYNGTPLYVCDNGHPRLIFGKHGNQRSFDRENWEIYLSIIAEKRKEELDYSEILGGKK